MDGYRVMEIMEEKGYLKHIPVLVISGEQAVAVERKCFDYGVTDFIRKPFDNELVDAARAEYGGFVYIP